MHSLMIQGTTSDAGKSVLVAALCRILHRRGVRVAPFKPQNMALNSAVTVDGGEIGRAQALQAQAAGLAPHTDFNPVLLKPTADRTAQVIVQGKVAAELNTRDYQAYKPQAMQAVLASWARLQVAYDCVLVEGAGSPAEINLRAQDIANMGFAEAVDCPVILIADIDRGGVFAHLVGTLALLSASERARVAGFVINRFRGDISLLEPGLRWLEAHTGKPVLGVVPYLHGLFLDAEDSLTEGAQVQAAQSRLTVRALAWPRIANHTDLDPLRLHPEVDFAWVRAGAGAGAALPPADLIVLPGSKAVRADLAWARAQGWVPALARHLRYGGKLAALGSGMQMLGTALDDPQGVEGAAGSTPGLGWLAYTTTLAPARALGTLDGTLCLPGAPAFRGYAFHLGTSHGAALARPALQCADGRSEGALSEDGQILASTCHGLFEHPQALAALLAWAGAPDAAQVDLAARREQDLDRLADAVETALDWTKMPALGG